MNDAPPPDERAAMERLRELLGGRERKLIQDLAARLDDTDQLARDLARALPRSIVLRAQQDEELAAALADTIEQSLTESVRERPDNIAGALFPVMGPTIKRSIIQSIRDMVQSLNQVLENSLSWRGIQWRIEAWRTGSSFGEIVLKHTLVYRVELVLLIHRETGIMLDHVSIADDAVADADLVSSMLTAVQDFVRDSFQASQGDHLEGLQLGELSVMIEQGPKVAIALAMRGEAPRTVRDTTEDVITTIHQHHRGVIKAFERDGDVEGFVLVRPQLERLLLDQSRRATGGRPWRALLVLGVLLLLILGLIGWGWYERHVWQQALDAIDGAPGVRVLRADPSTAPPTVFVLRQTDGADPFTEPADPVAILAAHGYGDDDVQVREVQGVRQVSDTAIQLRLRQVLDPPAGVTVTVAAGSVTIRGDAAADWVTWAPRLARLVPDVRAVDTDGLHAFHVEPTVEPAPPPTLEIAYRVLEPPNTIELAFRDGVLTAVGSAETAWAERARNLARGVPGVSDYDDRAVTLSDRVDAAMIAENLGTAVIRFQRAASEFHFEDLSRIDRVVNLILSLAAEGQAEGQRWEVLIRGHTDSSGSARVNETLSAERAEAMRDVLVERGIPANMLRVEGVADREPVREERNEEDRSWNRSVTFHPRLASEGP